MVSGRRASRNVTGTVAGDDPTGREVRADGGETDREAENSDGVDAVFDEEREEPERAR